MIVDFHTHVWDSPDQLGTAAAQRLRHSATPWSPADASVTSHERAMQPVQKAVVLGMVCRHIGANIGLEQVAHVVARQPGRLAGFAGIDPMADNYLDLFEQAMEVGLAGMVISPAAQDFHPTHTRAMRLYDRCAQRGIPVMVHPGYALAPDTKLEFDDPVLFDEVARSFPDLKLIIAQVGHPWIDQTLVMLSKHSQVYADLTDVIRRPWQLYHVLFMAHQQGVIGNLLFGSDFPFCTPERAITTIYSINTLTQGTHLPSVPREQLRSVVERDSLTCLGIGTGLRGTGLDGLNVSKADPEQASSSVDDDAIADLDATADDSAEAERQPSRSRVAGSAGASAGHSFFRRRGRSAAATSQTDESEADGSDDQDASAHSQDQPKDQPKDQTRAQAKAQAESPDPVKDDAHAPGDLPDFLAAATAETCESTSATRDHQAKDEHSNDDQHGDSNREQAQDDQVSDDQAKNGQASSDQLSSGQGQGVQSKALPS